MKRFLRTPHIGSRLPPIARCSFCSAVDSLCWKRQPLLLLSNTIQILFAAALLASKSSRILVWNSSKDPRAFISLTYSACAIIIAWRCSSKPVRLRQRSKNRHYITIRLHHIWTPDTHRYCWARVVSVNVKYRVGKSTSLLFLNLNCFTVCIASECETSQILFLFWPYLGQGHIWTFVSCCRQLRRLYSMGS